MRIETIGPGPHPDIAIAGASLTVVGHAIDCEAEQRDERVIIDLFTDGQVVSREPLGRRVAAVAIPPRQYIEVDEERLPQPLATDTILLTLWEM